MTKYGARFLSANGLIKTLRLLLLTYLSIHANLVSAQDKPNAVALIRTPTSIVLDEQDWRDAPCSQADPAVPEAWRRHSIRNGSTHHRERRSHCFGFECKDPHPNRLSIHTMRRDETMARDGQTLTDDTVSIVLDTYGDHRTGYFFQINAAGTRTDGLISNPESVSLDWDGIWDARTARTKDGWSAEIVIPSRTLSFTRGLRV